MQEWIDRVLASPDLSLLMLPALMLLGAMNAMVSCCNIPVIGALAGYASAKKNNKYRDIILSAVSFMLGTILALVAIGAIIGYTGQTVSENFGRYSKILAGLIAVFFGLMTLNLVPINKLKIPKINLANTKIPQGIFGTIIFGFALGGASMACNISCLCGPVFVIAVGVASLQGQVAKSVLLMGIYAIGYSIPLTAILLGVSFGKWSLRASRAIPIIRIVAGVLLLAVGFYFLLTV